MALSKAQAKEIKENIRIVFIEEKQKGNIGLNARYIVEQIARNTRKSFKQPTVEHHLDMLVGAGVLNVKREGKYKMYSMTKHDFPEISEINWAPTAQVDNIIKTVKDNDGQMTFADAMDAMNKGESVQSVKTDRIFKKVNGGFVNEHGAMAWPEMNEMNNLWTIAVEVPPCPICGSRASVVKDRNGWYCQCMSNICQCRMKSFPLRKVACEQFVRKEVKI